MVRLPEPNVRSSPLSLQPDPLYTIFMIETDLTTYTSPRTGLTYEVKFETAGYERYNILLDGKWVQFALTLDDVEGSVAHYEGVTDGWYCLPRD